MVEKAVSFLVKIYAVQCNPGDYIILSVKGPGIPWRDLPVKYDPKKITRTLTAILEQYPSRKYDLYWSPMPYSQPRRKKSVAGETKFMAQDIDEHDDPEGLDPRPSYIWESSPNKFQGLWELDRYIKESEYTPFNKALAAHIGCDDCFDFCHVYRIPYTRNHKYKNNPRVGSPTATDRVYKPLKLKKAIGYINPQPKSKKAKQGQPSPSQGMTERKLYAKYQIPQRVKELLALEDLEGVDRSSTIWYVENKLHDLGMAPNEIIFLIKNSVFNKYSGRADQEERLKSELEKIISGEIEESSQDSIDGSLKITSFDEVMGNSRTFAGWLVKGFWGRRSHGIVAGMPKTFKSTMVHDLVISVASGKAFLGRFPVLEPGPVIVVQNENADYIMQDRTAKIIKHRDLVGKVKTKKLGGLNIEFPPSLPITFFNQQGFTLTNPDHRKQLEKAIEEVRPVLVVFDPLYLMFDGEINSAKELNPVLNWLLYLKTEYKTSVMVVHHYNKGSNTNSLKGGARMAGSVMLYGWVESAWYISKNEEDKPQAEDDSPESVEKQATISLTREFRMAGQYPDLDIAIEMGEVGNPHYDIDVKVTNSNTPPKRDLKKEVISFLSNRNRPTTKKALMGFLGVDSPILQEVLDYLLKNKKIVQTKGGYRIPKGD